MFENTFQGPGNGTYMDHTIEILLMLLVAFLLGLLLGYILWYKWQKLYLELKADYDRLKATHLDLEKDHASLRYKAEMSDKENHDHRRKISLLEGDITGLNFKLNKCQTDLSTAVAASVAGIGVAASTLPMGAAVASVPDDDLKIVEGIGPKIEQLCFGIGVRTFSQLAETSVETLQKMLDDAGPAYRTADPATWAKQAGLASEGKWDELKTYQEFLSGGKTPE